MEKASFVSCFSSIWLLLVDKWLGSIYNSSKQVLPKSATHSNSFQEFSFKKWVPSPSRHRIWENLQQTLMGVTHPFLVLVMFSIKEKEETRTLFDTSSMSGATMLMLVRTTMYSSGLPFQYLIGVSIQRERSDFKPEKNVFIPPWNLSKGPHSIFKILTPFRTGNKVIHKGTLSFGPSSTL